MSELVLAVDLTEREAQLVHQVLQGLSTREIADALSIAAPSLQPPFSGRQARCASRDIR